MSLISGNIKFLRKQQGLTQEQMAQRLGIKRSLLGAYEEGRAEPGLQNLLAFAKAFSVRLDYLVGEDLAQPDRLKELMRKEVEEGSLKILSVTVDPQGNENIHLVPQKAAAGYTTGYADPEYVSELPGLYLPMFRGGSFRAFEIVGDSMLPLVSGTVIIGQYTENLKDIRNDHTYVIVTKHDGIVYKRVFNHISSKGVLHLVSDNNVYAPYDLPAEDIQEVWEAKAFLSTNFPSPDVNIHKLTHLVMDLQQQVMQLKK